VLQVGPCLGMDGGDHMWMSRYILYRLAESYNVEVTFDPKPIPGMLHCYNNGPMALMLWLNG
jgi:glutamine synthetase